ncbi:MAG: hypothetical protein JWN04_767 [Myxococcaceae bacterium]|nr:hypothetical protein [Myxococcaceae bacterium]
MTALVIAVGNYFSRCGCGPRLCMGPVLVIALATIISTSLVAHVTDSERLGHRACRLVENAEHRHSAMRHVTPD